MCVSYEHIAIRRGVAFASVGHSAVGEVTRETSTSLERTRGERGEGWRWRLPRETRSKMGLELQISLFSVSPGLYSRTDLSLRSAIDRPSARPLALTPERVRGAYRRACFKESSLDDKSPDFAGFKFVTVLNCDASASLLLPSS